MLDESIEILHRQGLGVILGTPTATPPKWLIDEHPDILPVAEDGHIKKFGSRRHYSFSSPTYFLEAARITEEFAKRFFFFFVCVCCVCVGVGVDGQREGKQEMLSAVSFSSRSFFLLVSLSAVCCVVCQPGEFFWVLCF